MIDRMIRYINDVVRCIIKQEGILGLFRHLSNRMMRFLSPMVMRVMNVHIKQNKVVVSNFAGKGFYDNPKYITEALLKKHIDLDIVWLVENKSIMVPPPIRTVKYGTLRMIYELATAKIWIDDCRKESYLRKSKKQFYLQTWHGGVSLKAVEDRAKSTLSKSYIRDAQNDSRMADVFLSECEWYTNVFLKCFWYDGEILCSGLPRSDALINPEKNEIVERVKKYYSLDDDIKILLYVPTFRQNHTMEEYIENFDAILLGLENKFGGKWVVIKRLHPVLSIIDDPTLSSEVVLNGTHYPDINDLLVSCDALITDFSSCMFDAYRLNKNVYLFASDYDEYISKERTLNFNIEDLPSVMNTSIKELVNDIAIRDETLYKIACKELNLSLGYYNTTGNASEIIADRIIEEIKRKR